MRRSGGLHRFGYTCVAAIPARSRAAAANFHGVDSASAACARVQRCLLASRVLQRCEHCFTSLYSIALRLCTVQQCVASLACASSASISTMLVFRQKFLPTRSVESADLLPHAACLKLYRCSLTIRADGLSLNAQGKPPCGTRRPHGTTTRPDRPCGVDTHRRRRNHGR